MPTNHLDRYGPGYRWADHNRRRYTLGRKLTAILGACLLALALLATFAGRIRGW